MKYGIIYANWIIIFEEEESDFILKKESNNIKTVGKYSFYKNWQIILDSKNVSKKCVITNIDFFIKNLEEHFPIENQYDKFIYLIQLNKIINFYNKELPFYPLVSVILACYNSINLIKYSIRSILKQEYKNIELIVIDDGSNDGSYEYIKKLQEKYNFRLERNEINKGAYYSRNKGIKTANGNIIAIQDADDISDPKRLKISIDHLINKKVEFVLSNGQKLNENNLVNIKVAMASLVIKKDFYNKFGYYDEETRHSGDCEILDRAYFLKFGEYIFKNFWYWLNYTSYCQEFYYHIYENLYYINENKNGITNNYNINIRLKYLNERRNYYLVKIAKTSSYNHPLAYTSSHSSKEYNYYKMYSPNTTATD